MLTIMLRLPVRMRSARQLIDAAPIRNLPRAAAFRRREIL